MWGAHAPPLSIATRGGILEKRIGSNPVRHYCRTDCERRQGAVPVPTTACLSFFFFVVSTFRDFEFAQC